MYAFAGRTICDGTLYTKYVDNKVIQEYREGIRNLPVSGGVNRRYAKYVKWPEE